MSGSGSDDNWIWSRQRKILVVCLWSCSATFLPCPSCSRIVMPGVLESRCLESHVRARRVGLSNLHPGQKRLSSTRPLIYSIPSQVARLSRRQCFFQSYSASRFHCSTCRSPHSPAVKHCGILSEALGGREQSRSPAVRQRHFAPHQRSRSHAQNLKLELDISSATNIPSTFCR